MRTPEEEAVDGGVRTQELKSDVEVAFPPHLPPVIVNTKAGAVTADVKTVAQLVVCAFLYTLPPLSKQTKKYIALFKAVLFALL